MESNYLQKAKSAVNQFMQGEENQQSQQAAQNAIQSAYNEATPEEKQQLQQLEAQLKESNQLK